MKHTHRFGSKNKVFTECRRGKITRRYSHLFFLKIISIVNATVMMTAQNPHG